ncbi:MAG: PAS domain S-box protein, partial [Desulfomonilaceae bacterium]
IIDREHKVVRINKTMADRLKMKPEEAVGRFCYTLCHGFDAPSPFCPHDQTMLDGKPHEVEIFEPHLNGTFFISDSPIYDQKGLLVGSVHVARDITDRKLMEQKLRESEELYRTLFESGGDSIYLIGLEGNEEGKIISANHAAAIMHGYPMEELLKLRIMDLDHGEEKANAYNRFSRILRGEIVREEVTHIRKDGSTFHLEINARLVELGGHRYAYSIDRDITRRKMAEMALRASEERMRTLIEFSPIGIRVAKKGRYVYVNPATIRMFGYEHVDEIIGLPVESLYVAEEQEVVRNRVAASLTKGNTLAQYEATGLTKDGNRLNLSVWVTSIEFESEPASLAFLIDMTKEKSLRQQLIQAQKMESLGALAGGVAHDFNNLLQVVIGYSELMISSRDIDEQSLEQLKRIKHAALDGAELARRLLAFSRKGEIDRVSLDLNEQVRKLKGMLDRTIPKMIEISLDLRAKPGMITADPTQIDQVLLNLAVNASDAMPDGGQLKIETANVALDSEECGIHVGSGDTDCVLLVISDTGMGMDPLTLERIYEPFFTTKGEGKGTGLGLSIVYGVVKRHGGFIQCSSEPGKGTTFKIYFPSMQESSPRKEQSVQIEAPRKGNETILLIDDEELVLDLGVKFLSHAGYTVITAHNGREALEIFRREKDRVSLVILDLVMPEIGGLQCLEQIKDIDPAAKVLIASGFALEENERQMVKSQAIGYLSKPYQVNHVLEAVRNAIDAN